MLAKQSFVADESVDYNLIKFLRNYDFSIYSVQEETLSLTDNQVLQFAFEHKAVLITEDKDFGELVFKQKLPHSGILLLRTEDMPADAKNELVLHFLTTYSKRLTDQFAVIKKGTLRIKKIKL